MAANHPSWNSHEWETRSVELESRVPAIHYTCRNCARQFLEEGPTGARYAVHVGIVQFDRLSEDVTRRWLSEVCPGERLEGDFDDSKTRFRSGQNQRKKAKSGESSEGPEPQ
jgi:hypothetical protein